ASEFRVCSSASLPKLAAACIRYMQSEAIQPETWLEEWERRPRPLWEHAPPLWEYVVRHWDSHLRIGQTDLTEPLVSLVIGFLQSEDTVLFRNRALFGFSETDKA